MRISGFGRFLWLFGGIFCFAATSSLVHAAVNDDAELFSASAVAQADALIEEIRQSTNPPKSVEVQTVSALPSKANAQTFAEEVFRSRRLNGILLYIVKDPHKLVIVIGKNTQARFQKSDDLRNVIIRNFKSSRYDEGLLEGLAFLRRELPAAFGGRGAVGGGSRSVQAPLQRSVSAADAVPSVASGFGMGRLIFMALLAFAAIRLLSGGRGFGRPGFGRGGFGGSPFLTGLFGGLAGNYLYNHLFGGGMGNAWGSQTPPQDYNAYNGGPTDSSFLSDDGAIGSSSSGSWNDGGDFGGGGGFDGGGGGGGSDW